MRFKIVIFISIFFGLFLSTSMVFGGEVYSPVVEKIDLLVDGSITPITKNLTTTFDYITHITIELDYDDPVWIGTEFGESTALVNGTQILYKGTSLLGENIKKNDHFIGYFEDTDIFQDDKSPAWTHTYAKINCKSFFGQNLQISALTDLQFIVNDNITAVAIDIQEFEVYISGYTMSEVGDNRQAPPNIFSDIQDFAVEFMKEPLWWVTLLIPAAAIFVVLKYK